MAGLPFTSNLELWVHRQPHRFSSDVFLIRRMEGSRLEVITIDEKSRGPHGEPVLNGTIVVSHEAMLTSELKPFLTLSEPFLREFFIAAMKYADENGIPRPSEDHMKGKLEATERHLEDVRKLLFQPKHAETMLFRAKLMEEDHGQSHTGLEGEWDTTRGQAKPMEG